MVVLLGTLYCLEWRLGRGGTFERHIQGLKVHDRNCWKVYSATLSSWLPIACNMFARPCQTRSERQARRKSHQVMTRSVAAGAKTIVVLSIGNMKRRAAFGHMTWSSSSVRDFVGNGWVLAHTSRLISFVGFAIVQSCLQDPLSHCPWGPSARN